MKKNQKKQKGIDQTGKSIAHHKNSEPDTTAALSGKDPVHIGNGNRSSTRRRPAISSGLRESLDAPQCEAKKSLLPEMKKRSEIDREEERTLHWSGLERTDDPRTSPRPRGGYPMQKREKEGTGGSKRRRMFKTGKKERKEVQMKKKKKDR